MKRALTNIAAGCASAALLMGATALSANAYYLGYGNGDPGGWDFWAEQHNGQTPAAQPAYSANHHHTAHIHHAAVRPAKQKHVY